MKTYLFSYRYEGNQYSLEIPAENLREAKERLKVIPLATYDGILIAKVPAVSGGWLPSMICRISNWFRVQDRQTQE